MPFRFAFAVVSMLCVAPLAAGCSGRDRPAAGDEGMATDAGAPGPASCDDGFRNGDETAIDCGGSCPKCPDGQSCGEDSDCTSGACDGICRQPACDDGVQNGDELDVDCGGPCDPCPGGSPCNEPDDCLSNDCTAGTCEATTCFDDEISGTETDVDCGGDSCPGCDGGQMCDVDDDCASLICQEDGTCTTPTCDDEVRNLDETDVDCGGSTCAACGEGASCENDDDCGSGVCASGSCAPPGCDDGVRNGDETDVDCGGDVCGACDADAVCVSASDCASGVCDGSRCQAPACDDGVRNGGETDVDCGGDTGCPRCPEHRRCDDASDCELDTCTRNRCGEVGCIPIGDDGTDAYGYFGCSLEMSVEELPCADISESGTATGLSDDDHTYVDIGFDFDFYGTTYSKVAIQSNGTLTFEDDYHTLSNSCLPDEGTAPDRYIAAYWDDLDPAEIGSEIWYETRGAAPDRQLVVRYETERFPSSTRAAEFTVVLHEGSNDIQVCYEETTFGSASYDDGASATAGIDGPDTAIQYSCNSEDLSSGLLLEYRHP